jgi:hypothetical protein
MAPLASPVSTRAPSVSASTAFTCIAHHQPSGPSPRMLHRPPPAPPPGPSPRTSSQREQPSPFYERTATPVPECIRRYERKTLVETRATRRGRPTRALLSRPSLRRERRCSYRLHHAHGRMPIILHPIVHRMLHPIVLVSCHLLITSWISLQDSRHRYICQDSRCSSSTSSHLLPG